MSTQSKRREYTRNPASAAFEADAKSTPRQKYPTRQSALVTAALAALGSTIVTPAEAASTWVGVGGGVNWSLAGNWSGGTPTSSATTDLIFAGSTNVGNSTTPLLQNFASPPLVLNTLTFSSGGGAFFLGGSSLQFNGATNSIVQNSANAISIANSVTAVGKSNNTGTITLTGDGAGTVSLGGTILIGTGQRDYAIVKSGTSTYLLSGANTYGGGTTINEGTIVAGNATALGTAGLISVGAAGTLAIASGVTFTRPLTLTSGATLAGAGTYTPGAPYTVASGIHIAPGLAGAIGTLTLGNATTFAAGSHFDVALGAPGTHALPGSSSRLGVTGALIMGGNLNLTNTGAAAAGSYKIATQTGTATGVFTSVTSIGATRSKIDTGTSGSVFLDLYNPAVANLLTSPINLGNVHVGGSFGNTALSIQNTAPGGSFTEGLNAVGGTPGGAAGTSGSVTNLAGQAVNNSSLLVGLGGNSTTATAGAKTGTVVINLTSNGTNSGLGNLALPSQTITVNGGVYNLAAAASNQTVNIGATLVGTAKTAAVSLTNTAPVNASYTETLSTNGFSATSANFTATGSVTAIAGGASGSGNLTVGLGSGLAAGVQSGTTTLALNSNEVNSSGLGTTALTAQTITITGQVYDPANLAVSGLNLTNALAGSALRASGNVTSISLSNPSAGFTAVSTPLRLDAGNSTAAVTFSSLGKLNGTYSTGATITATNGTPTGGAITGAVAGDASLTGVNFWASVSGATSSSFTDIKSADVPGGDSYAGYSVTSANAGPFSGTMAMLLAGTNTGNSTVTINMSLDQAPTGIDNAFRRSDVLRLTGNRLTGLTGFNGSLLTDTFVLQMSSNTGSSSGYIGYYDATLHQFVNAISGNSDHAINGNLFTGGGIGSFFPNTPWSLAHLTLGDYGFDPATHTAWAVLDHNSEFAVIPEPNSLASLLGGLGLLAVVQRRRPRNGR